MPRRAAPKKNRSMPPGAVIPVLAYADVRAAVEWLCRAYGFAERLQVNDHRSQLVWGDGAVVIAGFREGGGSRSTAPTHSVMVRVADVDQHHNQAKKAGALIVSPPADFPYGERQYTAEDLGGHLWTFTETLADVDPESWGGVLRE